MADAPAASGRSGTPLRTVRLGSLGLFAIGLIHRTVQLLLLWPALSKQIIASAGNQVPTMLPAVVMRDHPWLGLWYLQQTPPISYGIWATALALFHTPNGLAISCLMLQAALSSATAAAMAVLLWRFGIARWWSFAIALVFLMSGGLLVIEYHTMGQMFHNLLTMLLLVLAGHLGITLSSAPASRPAILLGVCTGLLALTRATFSFFLPVMAAWLLLVGGWRRPGVLVAFLLPALILQGSWTLKNYLAWDYVSSATSSWGGANLYHGEVGRHGPAEFKQWIAGHPPLCRAPWYDLTVHMPPHSAIFYFIPVAWPANTLPPAVAEKDHEALERLGAPTEWNSLAAALWSRCLMTEFGAFWMHRPALLVREWWQSYEVFWHPISQYAVIQPTTLQPEIGVYSPKLNWWRSVRDAFGEVHDRYLMLNRGIKLEPLTRASFVSVPVIALPVLPELISALNFIVLHSLPFLFVVRVWRRGWWTPFPPGFWFLALVYAYAGGLSSIGEYSENMRYRLEVEPVIWVLSVLILREWIACLRPRAHSGWALRP